MEILNRRDLVTKLIITLILSFIIYITTMIGIYTVTPVLDYSTLINAFYSVAILCMIIVTYTYTYMSFICPEPIKVKITKEE